jgi:hypothetical protein
MAPQTLPLTVSLPIFPPTGAQRTLPIKLNFHRLDPVRRATSEKKIEPGRLHRRHLQRFAADATASSWASTATASRSRWARSCWPTSPTRTA